MTVEFETEGIPTSNEEMFTATKALRKKLKEEQSAHSYAKAMALEAKSFEGAFLKWQSASERKGRVEGIQLALEIVAKSMKNEADEHFKLSPLRR